MHNTIRNISVWYKKLQHIKALIQDLVYFNIVKSGFFWIAICLTKHAASNKFANALLRLFIIRNKNKLQ